MDSFNQLLQYCIEHKHWVTLNYSPYDQTYQIYVNPGRTMSAAKRHKTIGDAVRSCWMAMGVNPPTQWVNVSEKTDRKFKAGDFVEINSHGNFQKTSDPAKISGTAISDTSVAVGLVNIPVKRRGRPPGSKNKPKEA